MNQFSQPDLDHLEAKPDGTIKQRNPFTGTQVRTVPGRSDRPLVEPPADTKDLAPTQFTSECAFCSDRYLETPPEKVRIVRHPKWRPINQVPAEHLHDTLAEFRLVPNLYAIVGFGYWRDNYGYQLTTEAQAHKQAYLLTDQGRRQVINVLKPKAEATGKADKKPAIVDEKNVLDRVDGFFGGGHDLVVARRHFVDGAKTTDQLASAGTLTLDEHEQYIHFTVQATANLYQANPYVRYVVVFQNWLKRAGASFDHLHKQLVAIDEHGANVDLAKERVIQEPNVFNDCGVNYAIANRLLIAENDSAIAFAGFGHRYPTVEVYSKSQHLRPWEHSAAEVRDMSDLLHAIHAATGSNVPCNEEWHYAPMDVSAPMPWRINLKWRISTMAGFEGATKIYTNTLSPQDLRKRVIKRLKTLRQQGDIADLVIGKKCSTTLNPLRYNSA